MSAKAKSEQSAAVLRTKLVRTATVNAAAAAVFIASKPDLVAVPVAAVLVVVGALAHGVVLGWGLRMLRGQAKAAAQSEPAPENVAAADGTRADASSLRRTNRQLGWALLGADAVLFGGIVVGVATLATL